MSGIYGYALSYGAAALLLVLLTIPLLRRLAFYADFVDRPAGRKRHEEAVPPISGLAIFPIFVILLFLSGTEPSSIWIIASIGIILAVGAIDDGFSLPAWVKLIVQVGVAVLIVVPGHIRVYGFGDLFGFGDIGTSWIGIPFTIMAVVLVINAINLIDGLDGLAGGLGLIIIFWLAVCSIVAGDSRNLIVTSIFAGALIGFLNYNLRHRFREKASVFLGNSGSQAMGLTLAWLTIEPSQGGTAIIQPISVAWLLALPIYDICGQFARRVYLGRHPFDPDRHHFHHHFLYAGLSDGQATAIILALSFFAGIVGVGGLWIGIPESVLTYVWIVFLFIHIYMSMLPLRYLKLLLPLRGKSIDNIIGQLILESGAISEAQLLDALELQGKSGGKIGEILVEKGYISESNLIYFLNLQVVRNANTNIVNVNKKKDFLLGEIMLTSKMITKDQLEEGLIYQRTKGGWIGQVLLSMGYISGSDLRDCLEKQIQYRYADRAPGVDIEI